MTSNVESILKAEEPKSVKIEEPKSVKPKAVKVKKELVSQWRAFESDIEELKHIQKEQKLNSQQDALRYVFNQIMKLESEIAELKEEKQSFTGSTKQSFPVGTIEKEIDSTKLENLIEKLVEQKLQQVLNKASNIQAIPSHGYQIVRELGHNLTGGRITYLAKDIKTGRSVVIKQFQFAQPMGNWRDYDAIHQEIRVLQKLNHPSIPRYLDSFDTSTDFCLVQEYKNAPSLAVSGGLTPEDIQQIAVKCLEILIYLQQQQPVVIHRDIKPENILVSQDNKLYLVDFGLAKLEEGEILSTIAKGTFRFMPPEQIHSRQLTKASDLYSLGVTLICLLTKTKSIKIGDLIDENERINFRKKLPNLSRSFVLWLEKMVELKLEKRFLDAEEALKALNSVLSLKMLIYKKLI